MPDLGYAIAQLKVALETAENNAPVREAEGDADQAEASKRHAESFRDAISILERS